MKEYKIQSTNWAGTWTVCKVRTTSANKAVEAFKERCVYDPMCKITAVLVK